MNSCPKCGKSFPGNVVYCLEDGAVLRPPTRVLPMEDSIADTSLEISHHTNLAFPPQKDPLAEGAQVGEYIVGGKIGDGGMGVIYSGVHPVIGKKVAIKVLHHAMAANPEIVHRFILEAKAVNQIGHRHIVDIFSFGRLSDGRQYFAMEFLEGQSLAQRIEQDIPVPWEDTVQICLQVASAVEAAHLKGIIHRDLKPDNIFVTSTTDGPFVTVLDFGIAKLLGDQNGLAKTNTGVPIGTPAYMSPEQACGGIVDNRTDIYAFGIILYETIIGRSPFAHHQTLVAVLTAHLTETPRPLREYVDIHPELDRFVMRMLAKDPGERPKEMAEVRVELVRLRDLSLREGVPLYGPKGKMPGIVAGAELASTKVRPIVASPTLDKSPSIRRGPEAATTQLRPVGATEAVSDADFLPAPPRRVGLFAVAAVVLVAGVVGIVGAMKGRTAKVQGPSASAIQGAKPVTNSPAATGVVVSPAMPKAGRLTISTNAMATRIFLDKSATERSTEPAAAGGMNLKVPVPANIDWVLRVEAEGFKPVTMPLRIAEGEETSLPIVLTASEAPKSPRLHGVKPHLPPPTGATVAPQPNAGNENFINPF